MGVENTFDEWKGDWGETRWYSQQKMVLKVGVNLLRPRSEGVLKVCARRNADLGPAILIEWLSKSVDCKARSKK